MKAIISFLIFTSLFFFGCKETIIEYQVPKEFTNDLLHADLVGKVVQKGSKAKVIISQVAPIDSVEINPNDGSFACQNLRIGNYDITIRAENFRIYTKANVMITGGSITYLGEIDLSTIPDLVDSYYPVNNDEMVYDWRYGRITISILFTHPMDRESVEQAFSTNPPSEGIFYWGNYTNAPMYGWFADALSGFERGATITTFSKVTSITFPRRMNKQSVEMSTHITPQMNTIFLWPEENVLRIYTGGPFLSDTTITVKIDETAKDKDGNALGHTFTFSFRTAALSIVNTYPDNGQLFVVVRP